MYVNDIHNFFTFHPYAKKTSEKKVNVQLSMINECSCCLEQSYLFDRVDINHVGVDERGQGKNMTRVCRLRSVLGWKSVHVCS